MGEREGGRGRGSEKERVVFFNDFFFPTEQSFRIDQNSTITAPSDPNSDLTFIMSIPPWLCAY